MRLDVSVFRQWRMLQNENVPEIVTDFNPYVFGSLNVENSKDVFDAKSELSHVDTKLLAKIFWFDMYVRNTDRTDFNSNLLANGSVYIIDHNNAFDSNFSVSRFLSEHILREFRDALSVMEREDFRRSVVELANGAFLDEVWGEMPEEWTDAAEESLPLPRIKAILQEGCDVGIA